MSFPAATSGIGVAAKVKVAGNQTPSSQVPGKNNIYLSLTSTVYPNSFQLNPVVTDAAGTPVVGGTALVLTAVASSGGGVAVYTGTITGGASNALAGKTYNVAGFATAVNNGSFIATASSATTLTLQNAVAVAETHAATATSEEGSTNLTYVVDGAASFTGGTKPSGTRAAVCSVSATGLITLNGVTGRSTVEVSYPTFNNAIGTTGAVSPNPAYLLPKMKVFADVTVHVLA